MIQRLLSTYLIRDAGYYPVLTLTGPRQSGKTTLARATFPGHAYVSLEDGDARDLAKSDPRGFLARYPGPVVIDEAQRVPDLLSYLQVSVDSDPRPGRIVLTGSQNLLLMEKVSQTLAGRCGVLHLLPFSRVELAGQSQSEPAGPDTLFANRVPQGSCWDAIRTGFYPPIHDRHIPPEVWLSDYLRTFVERDVRAMVNVGDLDTFERFLALCAGRIGQILSYSSLASDCGVSVDTARRWISVLSTSFILFRLTPFHRNFSKRVIKSPKLYFWDTGLACHILGIRDSGQLENHPLRGALFENLVVTEVAKAYWNHRRQPPIHFWRDQTGHEVDLLIEEGGVLYPIEIKSGRTVVPEALGSLHWWSKLAGDAAGSATLVYGGDDAYTQSDVAIRPWFAV
jgi:predicted AAA+ superfamily ATPase